MHLVETCMIKCQLDKDTQQDRNETHKCDLTPCFLPRILCFVQVFVEHLYALVRVSTAKAESECKPLEMTMKENRERGEEEGEEDGHDCAPRE